MSLNLAQRPFVNLRPVRRLGIILAVLGVALLFVNGYLYWNHLSGQGVAETGLQEVIEELENESRRLEAALAELEDFEPAELNRKIEFVNLRILQRTFSWSRLFDLLAETLPSDVRLMSLTPSFGDSGGGRRRSRGLDARADEVILQIRGESRAPEALLEFVDSLFAHRAFTQPDLHQEAARADSEVSTFSISTLYLPDSGDPIETEPAAAPDEVEAE